MSLSAPNDSFGMTPPAVSKSSIRPPTIGVVVQLVILVVAIVGFFFGGLVADGVIGLIAVFGSVLTFAIVRMIDDRRRTSPSYGDWVMVSARQFSKGLMFLTWGIGLVHVYRTSVEVTRVFNL